MGLLDENQGAVVEAATGISIQPPILLNLTLKSKP
jgi:hypothetical protein